MGKSTINHHFQLKLFVKDGISQLAPFDDTGGNQRGPFSSRELYEACCSSFGPPELSWNMLVNLELSICHHIPMTYDSLAYSGVAIVKNQLPAEMHFQYQDSHRGFLSHGGYPKSSKSLDNNLILKEPWWVGDAPCQEIPGKKTSPETGIRRRCPGETRLEDAGAPQQPASAQ